MLTLEERISRSKERTKRLEIEKKMKEKREQEAKRKQDTRRHIFIGTLVEEHFPIVSQFQPQRSESDNRNEFALIDTMLNLLAKDEEYLLELVENAKAILAKQQ